MSARVYQLPAQHTRAVARQYMLARGLLAAAAKIAVREHRVTATEHEFEVLLLSKIQQTLRDPAPVPPVVYVEPVCIRFDRQSDTDGLYFIGIYVEPINQAAIGKFTRGQVTVAQSRKRKE